MNFRCSCLMMLALASLLSACGGNDEKATAESATETAATAKEADGNGKEDNELLADDVPAPPGFTFQTTDFEGLGMMPLPSGAAWSVEDNPMGKTYYNEALDMTVKIQTQKEGFMDQQKEYTDSYHQNNLRDAPQYQEVSRTFGKVAGYDGCVITGTYSRDQPYVTKDFLFFTAGQATILQTRTLATNKAKLLSLADHMVSNLKK